MIEFEESKGKGSGSGMKKLIWFIGGAAAAAAGFLVWSKKLQTIHEPAYYLDEGAAEDATFV